MKTLIYSISIAIFSITAIHCTQAPAAAEPAEDAITEMLIENLFRDSLALAEDVEVVVSYLEVPPQSTLPTHYHPGEEFVYVIEGSGVVTLKDGGTTTLNKGDFFKVPLKSVHSFNTYEEAAVAVVFRVHEKGQPDRILVE